jgi:hypothetical protein
VTDPTPPAVPTTPPQTGLPTALIDVVQVLVSAGVTYGLAWLVHFVAKLPSNELELFYLPAVALYYAGVSALEKKYPRLGWLLYLLPTNLPT